MSYDDRGSGVDDRSAADAADYQEDGASWRAEGFRGGLHSSPRVSYYFPQGIGNYHFGERHPMKPHRLELTNHLVAGYDLFKLMDVYTPRIATQDELETFHGNDYIDFLSKVTPENVQEFSNVLSRFNIGEDCPIFDGLYDYCRQYSGASLAAARKLAAGQTDIAINWTGGLHHAKKFEASGFCYVNDIVLAILQLLRTHARVLYIDIDIHHGDGVQEAFYNSNRVLTVSFHKFSESFFPGTGHVDEIGNQLGKYFSLNVPLQDGIDDESYVALFKSIMEPVMMTFRPSVVVLQCGADSLGCDRLGCFNLSISAHGECVRFIKAFGIPLLVLGGGGYTIRNVSRCWTYETAVLLDAQHSISNALPSTAFDAFFAPDYKLHPPLTGRVDNINTRRSLERIRRGVLERLRFMHGAPSVAMQTIPPDLAPWLAEEEEKCAAEEQDDEDDEGEARASHGWTWSASSAARKDGHRSKNEYFLSRRDQDSSSTPVSAQRSRKKSSTGGSTLGTPASAVKSLSNKVGPKRRSSGGKSGGRQKNSKGQQTQQPAQLQETNQQKQEQDVHQLPTREEQQEQQKQQEQQEETEAQEQQDHKQKDLEPREQQLEKDVKMQDESQTSKQASPSKPDSSENPSTQVPDLPPPPSHTATTDKMSSEPVAPNSGPTQSDML